MDDTKQAGLPPLPAPAGAQGAFTAEQLHAYALAERRRIYDIVLRAPFNQVHCDDDDGWGQTEMALKAMAFEITLQIDCFEIPKRERVVVEFPQT
jgi:hypothetical protein